MTVSSGELPNKKHRGSESNLLEVLSFLQQIVFAATVLRWLLER